MITEQKIKSKVFNIPVESLSIDNKKSVYQVIFRTLFYLRIGQLELISSSKSQYISEELKTDMRDIMVRLKSYDQKVRALVPTDMGKHLTKELSKDKIYDLTNIMEFVAQINESSYEEVMSVMVDFISILASKKDPINVKKYTALFKFITAELAAEDNGQTSVSYNQLEDSITLNIVQPKRKLNAIQSKTATGI